MVVVSSSLDVLINLAKYDRGREVMIGDSACAESVAATLADVAGIYKEKSADIFARACSVLWTLASSSQEFTKVTYLCELGYPWSLPSFIVP